MWELFEMIFGGLFELAELCAGFRFYVCLVLAAIMIAVIYAQVESEAVSLALSVPLAMGALIAGVVWEWRSAL